MIIRKLFSLLFIVSLLTLPAAALAQSDTPINVDDIVESPELYYGRQLSISGELGESYGSEAFALVDDGDFIDLNQESILVIDGTLDGLSFVPVDEANLMVTGTLRRYDPDLIARDFSLPIDAEIYQDRIGEPVLIATLVTNENIVTPLRVDQIMNANTTDFYGQYVTVTGELSERIGSRTFMLQDEDLVDLDQESILVMDVTTNELDFIASEGSTVEITGVVQEFNAVDIEADYGLAIDSSFSVAHEGDPVLLASYAENLDIIQPVNVDRITDDPGAFYGHVVTVRGEAGDAISLNSFELLDEDIIDLDQERIAVMNITPDGFAIMPLPEDSIQVTGTIHPFDVDMLEAEYGYAPDMLDFSEYDINTVIVANNYVNLD